MYKLLLELLKVIIYHFRQVIIISVQCFRITAILINDYFYDKKLNINTIGKFNNNASNNSKDQSIYEPVRYAHLIKIFHYVQVNHNDVVADVGCGMGRIICFMSGLNCKTVIGIEHDKHLYGISLKNISNIRVKNAGEVKIFHSDAIEYAFHDETVIFFYNPFGFNTFGKVFNNINHSIEKNPRHVKLIYYNPLCRYLIDIDNSWEYKGAVPGTRNLAHIWIREVQLKKNRFMSEG